MRVLLIDDSALFQQGLRSLLELALEYESLDEVSEQVDALRAVQEQQPDVIIWAKSLPILEIEGVIRKLKRSAPQSRLLVLTPNRELKYSRVCLQAGADGYFVRGPCPVGISTAIRALLSGQTFNDAETGRHPCCEASAGRAQLSGSEESLKKRLSSRERDVLRLIARGYTNRQIAGELGLSVKTVGGYRSQIIAKLDIHDVASLTRFALRHGLVSLDE